MKLAPLSSYLFTTTLLIGTTLTVSSTNWIIIWAGLEVNLISFIPILLIENNTHHIELTINYFIIQTIGSILILISYNNSTPFLFIALALNIGIAPFHFWFITIVSRTPWTTIIILITWQNVAPLTIINAVITTNYDCLFLYLGTFNAWLGSLLALSQTNLNILIAYSSVANIGWIISLLPANLTLSIFFIIYCATLIPILTILYINNSIDARLNNIPTPHNIVSSVLLISLASIPPTPGFVINWIALPTLLSYTTPPLSPYFLVLSAIPLAFVYITLVFNLWTTPNNRMSNSNPCISFIFPLIALSITLLTLTLTPDIFI